RPACSECSISESLISNSNAPGSGVARSNDTQAISRSRIRRALIGSLYPRPASWLLADHVQQGLALLVAYDLERPRQRLRQRRRILDLLGVAPRGAADQLVVRRGLEVRQRHAARLGRETFGRMALHGALHRVPRAVVEDDEEYWQVVGARDEVRGGRRAEDVGAVADAADDGLVRRRQFGAEGRAHAPAQAAGRRGAEVAPRRAERALGRVEVVFVHEDRVVVHEVADALGHPHHLERLLALRPSRGRGPRLAKASVLGVPVLRALGAGTPVHALA